MYCTGVPLCRLDGGLFVRGSLNRGGPVAWGVSPCWGLSALVAPSRVISVDADVAMAIAVH